MTGRQQPAAMMLTPLTGPTNPAVARRKPRRICITISHRHTRLAKPSNTRNASSSKVFVTSSHCCKSAEAQRATRGQKRKPASLTHMQLGPYIHGQCPRAAEATLWLAAMTILGCTEK
jgi:hypothetical protein